MADYRSYNVNLHILSPVHIGSGQELDPFTYVIRNQNLLLFDLLKWMEGYADKETLIEKMDSEDFVALRTYIAENFNNDSAVLSSISVKSPVVLDTYQRAIKNKRSENQVLINFMTRNEITRTPYIPGSSIKGAIRTALANRFVAAAGVMKKDKRDYNKKIFGGNVLEDPLKNLKVSDVSLNGFGSFVYEAKEHSRKPDQTPKGGFEASASLCAQDSPVTIPLHFSLKNFKLFNETVDLQFIVDTLNDFYLPKYKDEYQKFYSGPDAQDIQQAMAPMSMAAIMLNSNETLIRIGHFSHVECVTLDHVRDPQTRKGKDGKPLPWGMTRTLANGVYPFGWAKLEFMDLPSKPRLNKDWPFSVQEIAQYINTRKEAREKAEAARNFAREQQQAEEQKLIAKERHLAELKAMLPEDRMIIQIKDTSVNENQVVEIFKAIDTFPEDKKNILAEALKDYWQRNNKWKKKECSVKQWEKVQKIKKILNED